MFHHFTEGSSTTTPQGADFSHAVCAAQSVGKGFVDYKKTSFEKRLGWARAFISELEQKSSALSAALSKELGYPTAEAHEELTQALQQAQALLELATPAVPVGPALIFGSNSSPVLRMAGPILTALLNGNTALVYSSASPSPLYSQLAALVLTAGFPTECLAVLSTDDKETLETLLDHPALRAVHFSGHYYEGEFFRSKPLDSRKIYKVSFGGRNPVIFLHDAPVDNLRELAIRSLRFHLLGEKRFSRWFVQEKNYQNFCDRLQEIFKSFNPTDTGRAPDVIYTQQFQQQAASGLAKEKNWLAPPGLLEGTTLRPALSLDFNNCSPWQQSEVLGPVLTVTRFKNSAEAVKFCNTTFYADSACVFSSSDEKSREVALQLTMPKVFVNKFFTPSPTFADHGVFEAGFGMDQTDFDFFRQKKILF